MNVSKMLLVIVTIIISGDRVQSREIVSAMRLDGNDCV
jgi:hypothetical protein